MTAYLLVVKVYETRINAANCHTLRSSASNKQCQNTTVVLRALTTLPKEHLWELQARVRTSILDLPPHAHAGLSYARLIFILVYPLRKMCPGVCVSVLVAEYYPFNLGNYHPHILCYCFLGAEGGCRLWRRCGPVLGGFLRF